MQLLDYFSQEDVVRNTVFFALGLSNSDTGTKFLSFLDDIRFVDEVNRNTSICGLILKNDLLESIDLKPHIEGIVLSDNPRKSYFELHNKLSNSGEYYPQFKGTIIGENCFISPTANIDSAGVIIGDNVVVEDFVRIKAPCIIGSNSFIHAGAKIGGDGFEFKRYQDSVLDVVHCGSVEIGENVIIWENVTVHKAVYPWDKTIISDWCRIGAQTHIDHGAKIFDYVEVCARCIISGRVSLGAHVFVGPGSIISNRIQIGEEAKVLIGSVVTQDVSARTIVSGNFAIEHDKHMERVKADSNMVFR